jgi:hypothetical protein
MDDDVHVPFSLVDEISDEQAFRSLESLFESSSAGFPNVSKRETETKTKNFMNGLRAVA